MCSVAHEFSIGDEVKQKVRHIIRRNNAERERRTYHVFFNERIVKQVRTRAIVILI